MNSIQVYLPFGRRSWEGSVCEYTKFVNKHSSYIKFYYRVRYTHIILSLQEKHELCAYYHLHYILVVFVTHIRNCTKIVKEADS